MQHLSGENIDRAAHLYHIANMIDASQQPTLPHSAIQSLLAKESDARSPIICTPDTQSECGCDVGLFEIVPLKEEGLADDLGKRIGKAVTKIQACRVSALPEIKEGLARDMRLLDSERFDDNACPAEKNIALAASVRSDLTFDHDGELQEARSAHPAAIGGVDELDE